MECTIGGINWGYCFILLHERFSEELVSTYYIFCNCQSLWFPFLIFGFEICVFNNTCLLYTLKIPFVDVAGHLNSECYLLII